MIENVIAIILYHRTGTQHGRNGIYGAMAPPSSCCSLETAAVILFFGDEVTAEIDRARIGRSRARRSQ